MRMFALEGSRELGCAAAASLSRELDEHEERDFEDGEHKCRPVDSVRGEEVFVLACLAGDGEASANDRLVKLLFFLAACRENGADRVTAVVPYLAYSRKDRQTKRRDPVTTRYVAQLFEAVGTDRVITLDVHNVTAFQNAFRCRTLHLEARRLLARRIHARAADGPVTIFSPDSGGIKRAQLLRETYEGLGGEARLGLMEKRRSGGVVSGDLFAGEVEGTAVFLVDDMISTGGTMLRAAAACRQRGAASVSAVATHGLFRPGSENLLQSEALDAILVTDSVPAAALIGSERVEVVPVGPLIGETIRRLSSGEPVGDLAELRD
jgi:ribose-phosphate pyrophosphokinase